MFVQFKIISEPFNSIISMKAPNNQLNSCGQLSVDNSCVEECGPTGRNVAWGLTRTRFFLVKVNKSVKSVDFLETANRNESRRPTYNWVDS